MGKVAKIQDFIVVELLWIFLSLFAVNLILYSIFIYFLHVL